MRVLQHVRFALTVVVVMMMMLLGLSGRLRMNIELRPTTKMSLSNLGLKAKTQTYAPPCWRSVAGADWSRPDTTAPRAGWRQSKICTVTRYIIRIRPLQQIEEKAEA
jgi:hypothetical protein